MTYKFEFFEYNENNFYVKSLNMDKCQDIHFVEEGVIPVLETKYTSLEKTYEGIKHFLVNNVKSIHSKKLFSFSKTDNMIKVRVY